MPNESTHPRPPAIDPAANGSEPPPNPQREQAAAILVAEHAALQTAQAATIFEANGRVAPTSAPSPARSSP